MSVNQYLSLINAKAYERNIPPAMLARQVQIESGGDPEIMGDSGHSYGLMQINDNTARSIFKMNEDELPLLLNPEYNLTKGTDYLKIIEAQLGPWLPKDQTERWAMIFMAYNSGPGYMLKALKNLNAKGYNNPTLALVLTEMKTPNFGRTPIFSVTFPYAEKIAKGFTTDLSKNLSSSFSIWPVAVAMALGMGLYFLVYKNRHLSGAIA